MWNKVNVLREKYEICSTILPGKNPAKFSYRLKQIENMTVKKIIYFNVSRYLTTT